MNIEEVRDALWDIAKARGSINKSELLKQHLEDPFFRAVCVYALDPYRTYGVAGIGDTCEEIGSFVPDRIDQIDELFLRLWRRELTGNAAKRAIQTVVDSMTLKGQMVVDIILTKDLGCGVTAKTINKIKPGLIPTFDVMLAQPLDREKLQFPVAIEPKYDGIRSTCIVSGKGAVFHTRTGHVIPAVAHLGEHVIQMIDGLRYAVENDVGEGFSQEMRRLIWDFIGDEEGNTVLDCEIISGTFNKTVSDVRKTDVKAADAELRFFDVVSWADWQSSKPVVSYRDRRRVLTHLLKYAPTKLYLSVAPSYIASSLSEIDHYYRAFRNKKLEGAMVKLLDAPYVRKRSASWQKMKNQETIDLEVVGVFEGTGKYTGQLGGIIVDHKGVQVRVGGGFTDQQRIDLWADHPIGRIAEVEFHEVTPDGSLRHPRFVCFRSDKED